VQYLQHMISDLQGIVNSLFHVYATACLEAVLFCRWTNSLKFIARWFLGSSCWLQTFSVDTENTEHGALTALVVFYVITLYKLTFTDWLTYIASHKQLQIPSMTYRLPMCVSWEAPSTLCHI